MVLLAVALMTVSTALAAIESKHKCAHPSCLEGTDINYSILIYNNLRYNVVIDDIYIKDVGTGQILALDARKEEILLSGDLVSFMLPSSVTAPSEGYTHYYVPCFTAKSFNDTGFVQTGEVCSNKIRSLTVVPLDEVECRLDAECSEEEYCNTAHLYKCRPLECPDNQTTEDHQCVDLECGMVQLAKDHKCVYNPALIAGIVLLLFIVFALIIVLPRSRVKHK